jgi:hypothetical protein
MRKHSSLNYAHGLEASTICDAGDDVEPECSKETLDGIENDIGIELSCFPFV